MKGDPGLIGAVAARIGGSADIYQARGQPPDNSINFVTSHDGFTLNDLVSYNEKHNEANGEGNRDGIDENLSWNCGVEGPTTDPAIEALRARQIKNFLTDPDALAGRADAARRRRDPPHAARQQQRLLPGQRDELVRLDAGRREPRRAAVRSADDRVPQGASGAVGSRTSIAARSTSGASPTSRGTARSSTAPGFDDPVGRALACTIAGFDGDADLHVMMNMFWEPLDFEVPVDPQRDPGTSPSIRSWPALTTSRSRDAGARFDRSVCTVQARSIVILASA